MAIDRRRLRGTGPSSPVPRARSRVRRRTTRHRRRSRRTRPASSTRTRTRAPSRSSPARWRPTPTIARPTRSVKHWAAADGPIINVKISSAPTTGTVIVVAQAMTMRNAISRRWGRSPRAAAMSGAIDAQQQRSIEDRHGDDADGAEHDHRHELARAHAEDLAEEQREDLGLVLRAETQERRAEGQHHHQRQRRDGVGSSRVDSGHRCPGPPPKEKTPRPIRGLSADEVRAGGAGEGAVGDGVRRERRAAQHDEESDDATDDGHHRPHLPRVHHEAAEHHAPTATVVDVASADAARATHERKSGQRGSRGRSATR